MLRFVLHRPGAGDSDLFGVAVLIFMMLRVIPGDMVEDQSYAPMAPGDPGDDRQERHRLASIAVAVQFASWLEGFATGDLHVEWTDRPVIVEIRERLELTVEVAVLAAVIATAIAIRSVRWRRCSRARRSTI